MRCDAAPSQLRRSGTPPEHSTLQRNLISAVCTGNLSSPYPEHMTIDEGQRVDRPVIQGLQRLNSSPQQSGTVPAFPQTMPQTACPSPTQGSETHELLGRCHHHHSTRLNNPSFSSREPSEPFLQKASHEEQTCTTHFMSYSVSCPDIGTFLLYCWTLTEYFCSISQHTGKLALYSDGV